MVTTFSFFGGLSNCRCLASINYRIEMNFIDDLLPLSEHQFVIKKGGDKGRSGLGMS